jgi:predicted RNA binding protein YcfA (HicA-like mRNA interferase family)
MTRRQKLLEKAENNPDSLSFEDFRTLLKHENWVEDHQKGSHQIWYSSKHYRISIQNYQGNSKSYQVKQFLKQVRKEKEDV